jgi:hypothetical protein
MATTVFLLLCVAYLCAAQSYNVISVYTTLNISQVDPCYISAREVWTLNFTDATNKATVTRSIPDSITRTVLQFNFITF